MVEAKRNELNRYERARIAETLSGVLGEIRQASEVRLKDLRGKNWFVRWWEGLKDEEKFRDNVAASELVFSAAAHFLRESRPEKNEGILIRRSYVISRTFAEDSTGGESPLAWEVR